uniref:Uncharacterized protein n=1 Tax=Amphora coffeiformis TaxID=265554 RepID=A0A7S3L7U5_9STRA
MDNTTTLSLTHSFQGGKRKRKEALTRTSNKAREQSSSDTPNGMTDNAPNNPAKTTATSDRLGATMNNQASGVNNPASVANSRTLEEELALKEAEVDLQIAKAISAADEAASDAAKAASAATKRHPMLLKWFRRVFIPSKFFDVFDLRWSLLSPTVVPTNRLLKASRQLLKICSQLDQSETEKLRTLQGLFSTTYANEAQVREFKAVRKDATSS